MNWRHLLISLIAKDLVSRDLYERTRFANAQLSEKLTEIQRAHEMLEAAMEGSSNQLKLWRARWRPTVAEEDREKVLLRSFGVTFESQSAKDVLDYLIETYYKPLQSGSSPLTESELAENNGKQLVIVDILQKIDIGQHPMAFEPEHSSEDEKPMEVRQ